MHTYLARRPKKSTTTSRVIRQIESNDRVRLPGVDSRFSPVPTNEIGERQVIQREPIPNTEYNGSIFLRSGDIILDINVGILVGGDRSVRFQRKDGSIGSVPKTEVLRIRPSGDRRRPGDPRQKYLGNFLITCYNVASESFHPTEPRITATGLGLKVSEPFLRDVRLQGTGVLADGRAIRIDWSKITASQLRTRPIGQVPFTFADGVIGASGRELQSFRSIAVDRSVIPMGSQVEIGSLGRFQADDTGGRIRGRHIDIFMMVPRSVCLRFGRRMNIPVWIDVR